MDEYGPADVTILDLATGLTAVVRDEHFHPFQWTENHYSCDCNRGGDPAANPGHCLGCVRFVAAAVDPMPAGYTLDEFNAGYPEAARDVARQWLARTPLERAKALLALGRVRGAT